MLICTKYKKVNTLKLKKYILKKKKRQTIFVLENVY